MPNYPPIYGTLFAIQFAHCPNVAHHMRSKSEPSNLDDSHDDKHTGTNISTEIRNVFTKRLPLVLGIPTAVYFSCFRKALTKISKNSISAEKGTTSSLTSQ